MLSEAEDAPAEEMSAILEQINEALSAEQQAILTNLAQQDLFAWAAEQGLMGNFANNRPEMDEKEMATAQAQSQPNRK